MVLLILLTEDGRANMRERIVRDIGERERGRDIEREGKYKKTIISLNFPTNVKLNTFIFLNFMMPFVFISISLTSVLEF